MYIVNGQSKLPERITWVTGSVEGASVLEYK
jgi:hypothetical protein